MRTFLFESQPVQRNADSSAALEASYEGAMVSVRADSGALGKPFATVRRNRLSLTDPKAWLAGEQARTILFSGTLADSIFEPHPHNWLPPGRAALDSLVDTLIQRLEGTGRTILLEPHCRHILNDAPGAETFLNEKGGDHLGLALAPVSLLEPAMLDHAPDHLERTFDTLGHRAAVVIISGTGVSGDCDLVMPGRLDDENGAVPPSLWRRLIEKYVPETTPIALHHAAWAGSTPNPDFFRLLGGDPPA